MLLRTIHSGWFAVVGAGPVDSWALAPFRTSSKGRSAFRRDRDMKVAPEGAPTGGLQN
jgi:hypothetical protein